MLKKPMTSLFKATEEEIEEFRLEYLNAPPVLQSCPYCGKIDCYKNPCEWARDERITGEEK